MRGRLRYSVELEVELVGELVELVVELVGGEVELVVESVGGVGRVGRWN